MTIKNIRQIIPFLRSAEYVYDKPYSNNYSQIPRPTYNFLIMRNGNADFFINGEIFKVNKNDVIWIPKGSTYSVEWKGNPALFSVLHFDFAISFDPFFYTKTSIQHLDCIDIENLLQDFYFLKENGIDNYMSISVFYKIFSNLFPLIKNKENKYNKRVIQPAIDYIETHYYEKISIKTLSRLCFISQSRFAHLFTEIIGFSPIAYKNRLLIQHIQQTIISDKNSTMQEIADKYNFQSAVYFCRFFKNATGLSPAKYRKMNCLI